MVSLTNQARLLAAQEFNRRVLEERARAGENIKTSASRVGVLTGRIARVDPRTKRVVGVTRTKSKTRLQSEKLLRAEIKRQQELARKESDLERFLRNESNIRAGRITASQLKKQIAERRKKGLSKTPAQREALKALERSGSIRRLEARQLRKIGRGRRGKQLTGVDQILSIGQAEEARAGILGSAPFADPAFEFGGRSRAEVIARGGTFGRRVAGESPAQQLSFVRGARIGTATARIGFAKSLLGDSFEQASSESLLGIVGSQRPSRDPAKRGRGALSQEQFAPPTFEQVLRQGVGFFTTEATPITKPKITKAERRQAVQARKAEDFAKAQTSREQIAEARARTRASRVTVGDLERTLGRQLDLANLGRAQAEFGFGQVGEQIQVRGQQRVVRGDDVARATTPRATSGDPRVSPFLRQFIERPARGRQRSPSQLFIEAQQTQRETEALRQAGASISPVAFATPRPSPARQEQIKVRGQKVTEPARQEDGFFDFFAGLGGAFQGLFGGAPLAESRAGGVRVTTGQAIEESADLFRQSAQPQNIFESAERLSRGELVGDVSLEQAFRESPLQDAPFGNFLQGFFR